MAEYRLTLAAERDLEIIWTHTRQQWGIEEANRYIDILAVDFALRARRQAALRVGSGRGACGVAPLANGITIGCALRLASIRAQAQRGA